MEVMAVTLTQFAKIPRLHINAHVKRGLKGTVNIVKTLMNAMLNTMVAVYMNVTIYQEIIDALATMDSIWHTMAITV